MQARERLSGKYRDHTIGYARHAGERVGSFAEANAVIKAALDRGEYLVAQFMRVLEPQVQSAAFGPQGSPGNADMIMHIAQRFADVYEGFMDMAANLRGAMAPDEFQRLREVVSHFYDQPIWRMHTFVDEFAANVHDLPQRVARGEQGIRIEMEVSLEIPEDLNKAATKEYKRLRRKL